MAMPSDSGRTGPRNGARVPVRERRLVVRREDLKQGTVVGRLLRTPTFGWGTGIAILFTLICGVLAVWSREQPLVDVGRVMNKTAIVRVAFPLEDPEETNRERERAKLMTPRVLVADTNVLTEIQTSLENLPRTLAGVASVDQVERTIADQFHLTAESFAAIQRAAQDGEPTPEWRSRVGKLMEGLRLKPLLDDQTWQSMTQEAFPRFQLQLGGRDAAFVPRDEALTVSPAGQPKLQETMRRMARDAGFTGPVQDAVVARIASEPRPTFIHKPELTVAEQNAAAAAVRPVSIEHPKGQVIFRAGDKLEQGPYLIYKAEMRQFEKGESWRVWFRYGSVIAAVGAVAMALSGYIALFCPRIRRSPGRMAGIAGILTLTLAFACIGTVLSPRLVALTAVAPIVLAAVILVVAYGQREALAFGALHGVLVCIALDQPIGIFALIITGMGMAVWQLREIRHRNALVRTGLYAGLALALGMVLVSLIDRPITIDSLQQTGFDALLAGFGGLTVGVIGLALLPMVERLFGVTTGMTLIELRDPRHPLLRQLQQRAPGTYNHSLNVAAISEAAADAIGADPLLTYAGALYHDVGKMNKPDYFVENLVGGPSKHDKLSPAMSLLVIVGHVKDGLELAREFGLPEQIQHFVEAHHGTTLVEFFFDRARKRALAEESEIEDEGPATPSPTELEYRYPGPKPRTKEVAIVMLADAVESATRTMAEPTPSRIDTLVRQLANQRLLDGQFDDCELTLRDLHVIAASISKSVAAIYHGRIAYPSTASAIAGGGGPMEKRA
jgi:putative nucleotidyltransferase with HDIG domain